MSKTNTKQTQPKMSQEEIFEAVLRENAHLRQQLSDKSTYETMEQLRIFVDIAKSNLFAGEQHSYILSKIGEVVFPTKATEEVTQEDNF